MNRLPIAAALATLVGGAVYCLWPQTPKEKYDERKPVRLAKKVTSNDNVSVIIYGADWCGHCKSTKETLDRKGIKYVMKDPKETMPDGHVAQKIPQIFVNGKYVGGASDLNKWVA